MTALDERKVKAYGQKVVVILQTFIRIGQFVRTTSWYPAVSPSIFSLDILTEGEYQST